MTALSKSVFIAPSFDTYVKETEPEASFSSRSTVEIDQGHTAYIGFERSNMSVPLRKARMFLTNHHIDSKKLFLHEVDSADWWHSNDGFDRTFSQVQKDEEGQPDTGRLPISLEEILALDTLLQEQPDMERINSNFKLWSRSPELEGELRILQQTVRVEEDTY